MRRENKLALIVGFSVLLVVAVLVSDHLSTARFDDVADGLDSLLEVPGGRAFVEQPLRTEPPAIAARPERSGAGQIGFGPNGNNTTTARGEDFPAYPPDQGQEIADGRGATDRLGVDEPVEINIGSLGRGQDDDRERGMTQITGIDPDTIRDLLARQKPVLVRTVPGTSSGGDATPTKPIETPRTTGHVPRDNKYVIQPNDTLFEICQRLYGDGTKWRELVAINKGRIREDGTVFPGVAIDLVPGVIRSPESRTSRTPSGVLISTPSRPLRESTRSYTVKKGDTLSEIVQREVGSVRHLGRVRDLNPWLETQKDNIRVGQSLTLPVARRVSARGH